jgi:hypothetical protein
VREPKFDGGPAFPTGRTTPDGQGWEKGLSLRQWYAGKALANPTLCTGQAAEWQLKAWFGDRGGVTREEIAAQQAFAYADAVLSVRK